MDVSIDWGVRVIHIPRAYLEHVSSRDYRLDIDMFRRDLRSLEASEYGMGNPRTHEHSTQVMLSGVTYARMVRIINGYTVEFEDAGAPYRVTCVGANHNISDVQVVNSVSLVIGNAAGLIVVSADGGSGTASTAEDIAAAVRNETLTGAQDPGSIGEALKFVGEANSVVMVDYSRQRADVDRARRLLAEAEARLSAVVEQERYVSSGVASSNRSRQF